MFLGLETLSCHKVMFLNYLLLLSAVSNSDLGLYVFCVLWESNLYDPGERDVIKLFSKDLGLSSIKGKASSKNKMRFLPF